MGWGEQYDKKAELAGRVEQFHLSGQHDQTSHSGGAHGKGVGRDERGVRIARKRRGLFAGWRTKRAQRANEKSRAEITHRPSVEFMNVLKKNNKVHLGDLGVADVKRFTKGDLAWMKNKVKEEAGYERAAAAKFGGDAIASAFTSDRSADRPGNATPHIRRSNTAQYAAWAASANQRAKAWDSQGGRIRGEELRRNKTVLQDEEIHTFEAETVEFANLSLDDWLDVIEYLEGRIEEGIEDPALAESAPLIIQDIEALLDGDAEEEISEEEGA